MAAWRVMCLLAHPNPEHLPNALHRCGNGHLHCVNKNHLEWGNAVENAIDRFRDNTMHNKLAEAQVIEIRYDAHLYGAWGKRLYSNVELAHRHGVAASTVRAVITRETWRHLP